MPENNKSPLSQKTGKFAKPGLAALLLCVLAAGVYLAISGGASETSPLHVDKDAGLEGFVPVEVSGRAVPHMYKEPGEGFARQAGQAEPAMQDEDVLAEAGIMPGETALSAREVDAALAEEQARTQADLQGDAQSRRQRLARLQQRLDKIRDKHDQSRSAEEAQSVAGETADEAPVQEAATTLAEGSVQKGTIARGETVSRLLDEYLSPAEVEQLEDSCKEVFPLHTIRAGHAYAVTLYEGDFKRFEYEIDREKKLVVSRTENGFEASEKRLAFETYTVRLDGEISLSLFGAIERIGESGELAMQLADIFGWEIDFIRDIRVGDTFRVLVEKRMRNGKFMGYGEILAAEFVNQGRRSQGYLFHDEAGLPGYYDAEGNSLRKAFLKAPLEFSRISSDFSWRRLHPILKKYRPHPGIDYAAPTGTPVRTVGNGTIIAKGWMGGGGNTVKIRHMNGYETLYMHLSRFARIAKGDKVEQGEIIGYVGSTGLSTGPHLDFRMKKNGYYINPHKVENPKAASLPQHMMPAFSKRAQKLASLLDDKDFSPVRDFAVETYMPDVAAR